MRIDGHAHVYRRFDLASLLEAAVRNADGGPGRPLALLICDTSTDAGFARLDEADAWPAGWTRQPVEETAALSLVRADGTAVTLIGCRQIVTAERLEVLAVATRAAPADGVAMAPLLDGLAAAKTPAILPWGVGKWMGARGKRVAAVVAERAGQGLYLGDNGGRPLGWPTPPLFQAAAKAGVAVLPGTDPLPVPGAEAGVARFGFEIEAPLDPRSPASDLAERLWQGLREPKPFGRRVSAVQALRDQIALRRSKQTALDEGHTA